MRRMAHIYIAAAGLMLAGLLAGSAHAASIVVTNPGFETVNVPFSNLTTSCPSPATPGITCAVYGGPDNANPLAEQWQPGSPTVQTVPGWTISGPATSASPSGSCCTPTQGTAGVWKAVYNPDGNVFIQAFEGQNVAYSNGGTLSQVLATSVQQQMVYNLSVQVGRRAEAFSGPGNIVVPQDYSISLYAGNLLLGQLTQNSGLIPGNSWTNVTFQAYSGFVPVAPLRIVLFGSGPQIDFDNVTLDVSALVPEPGTYVLMGSSLLLLGWFVQRRRKSA